MKKLKIIWVLFLIIWWTFTGSGEVNAFNQNKAAPIEKIVELSKWMISMVSNQPEIGYFWEKAVPGEAIYLYDLHGNHIAFLIPILKDEAEVGYLTVGANYQFPPVFEFSNGFSPLINLQKAKEIAENCGLLKPTVKRYIYFGGLDYYVEFVSPKEANIAVISLKRLMKIENDSLIRSQKFFENRNDGDPTEPLRLWKEVESLLSGKASVITATKRINGHEAYTWYRGCGPTSCTMLLNVFYNMDPSYFSNLHIDERQFSWVGPGGYTTYPYIDKGLCDLIADYCGVPRSGGTYNQYGVTIDQMKNSIRVIAANRGYTFATAIQYNDPNQAKYQSEIDADDPVVFGIYSDGSGSGYDSHAIMGYGYNYTGSQHYAIVHDTWDRQEHQWLMNAAGNDYDFVHVDPPQTSPTATPTRTGSPLPTSTPTRTPTARPTKTPTPQGRTMLCWSGGDPDLGDTVSYDIYFEAGDPNPNVLVAQGHTQECYDPGQLNYDTTYYWKVVARDNHGASTAGDVWNFKTIRQGEATPTPTATATLNPTMWPPNYRPKILIGGYWDTRLTSNGGNLSVIAYARDPEGDFIYGVQIYYQGQPTNIILPRHSADPNLFFWSIPIQGPLSPAHFLFELAASDAHGEGQLWPYLYVAVKSNREKLNNFYSEKKTSDKIIKGSDLQNSSGMISSIVQKIKKYFIPLFKPDLLKVQNEEKRFPQKTSFMPLIKSDNQSPVSPSELVYVKNRKGKLIAWQKTFSISELQSLSYSEVEDKSNYENNPPYKPYNPYPPNGATSVYPNR